MILLTTRQRDPNLAAEITCAYIAPVDKIVSDLDTRSV